MAIRTMDRLTELRRRMLNAFRTMVLRRRPGAFSMTKRWADW